MAEQQNRRHNSLTMEQAFALNNNQIPPQIVEIEESVLGALILDNDALVNNIERINPCYFYKDENRIIFEAINNLVRDNLGVDSLTVIEELKKMGRFQEVGGSYKIASITERITSGAHMETYVRMLAEKYMQRELIRVSTKTLKDAYDPTMDVLNVLDEAETSFLNINDMNFNAQEKSIEELKNIAIANIVSAQNSDSQTLGHESGYKELDNVTGGFQPGTLIILAARPAMGKTAFAMNIARNMAMEFNKSIAVFSLEMTAEELMMRLISSESEINGNILKRGDQLTTSQLEMVKEKAELLARTHMYIDDNPNLNIMELKAKCKRLKMKHDIDMVFIDYLQLINGMTTEGKGTNREQEISYISRQLKALSKELGIPILALSQLSRAVETRGGSKEPQLSDLRESGAIEQDADIVMFIYRPEYYGVLDDGGEDLRGKAFINIAKNRAGSVGKAKLGFNASCVKFFNLEDGPHTGGLAGMINEGFENNAGFSSDTVESALNNESDSGFNGQDLPGDSDESPF